MPDLIFASSSGRSNCGEWGSATIVIDLEIPTAKVQQVHLLRTTMCPTKSDCAKMFFFEEDSHLFPIT